MTRTILLCSAALAMSVAGCEKNPDPQAEAAAAVEELGEGDLPAATEEGGEALEAAGDKIKAATQN